MLTTRVSKNTPLVGRRGTREEYIQAAYERYVHLWTKAPLAGDELEKWIETTLAVDSTREDVEGAKRFIHEYLGR